MLADGVSEQRLVISADQPILPTVLFVGPPDGEVVDSVELVVDDGVVPNGGSHDLEAVGRQDLEENADVVPVDDGLPHGGSIDETVPTAGGSCRQALRPDGDQGRLVVGRVLEPVKYDTKTTGLQSRQVGVLLAAATAVISGVAIFANGFGVPRMDRDFGSDDIHDAEEHRCCPDPADSGDRGQVENAQSN